jgi:hypothetical protein
MRIFLIAALFMFVFALIVATGAVFVTAWNVWLCAGLLAWVLDQVVGDRFVIGSP